jgi:ABC-type nickel/cobalt efflux system permease component RcnA
VDVFVAVLVTVLVTVLVNGKIRGCELKQQLIVIYSSSLASFIGTYLCKLLSLNSPDNIATCSL